MFPAPTTRATSTPRPATEVTCWAIRATRSGSVPYSSEPMRASPESFSRTRLKRGDAIGWRSYGLRNAFSHRAPAAKAGPIRPRLLLAHLEAREPGDAHVLAGLRGQLGAQVLDRPALVAVGAHVLLLQQGDLPLPIGELPVDDLADHVVRLVLFAGLGLEYAPLRLTDLARDFIGRDVEGRRWRPGYVKSDLARELLELRRPGDEIGLAADLDQDADLAGGVDVGGNQPLPGGPAAALGGRRLSSDAQDLDR